MLTDKQKKAIRDFIGTRRILDTKIVLKGVPEVANEPEEVVDAYVDELENARPPAPKLLGGSKRPKKGSKS